MLCTNCCGAEKSFKYPNVQDLIKLNKRVVPFTLVGYEIDYSQFNISFPTHAHEKNVK